MKRSIAYLVGFINLFIGGAMAAPLAVSLLYGEREWRHFLAAMGVTGALSAAAIVAVPRAQVRVTHRVGVGAVVVGWLSASFFAALPFLMSGKMGGLTDCYFEAVSGFTTTGSSILRDIEVVPRGLLFWRCFIQWIGGMGIVLVAVAVFSSIGARAVELYKAEVPGLKEERISPRISTVARILWLTYAVITVVQVVMLLVGGMDLFDAVCHAFTTMATGGFSPKNQSIGHYRSAYIEWVIIVFTTIAGMNFSLHATVFSHRGKAYLADREVRFFLGAIAAAAAVVAGARFVYEPGAGAAVERVVRESVFSVVSLITTTGYATCDYEKWQAHTHLPSVVLVLVMFVGGMEGSTGGGMKCVRILLLFKMLARECLRFIHPRGVYHVKVAGRTVPDDILRLTAGFFVLYVLVFLASTLALAAMGIDAVTALTAVATTINNVGPGLGTVGPSESFAHLPAAAKWVLMADMIVGRLEAYSVIALLFPSFWKK